MGAEEAADKHHELEQSISSAQKAMEEISLEQERIGREQQELEQQAQDWADAQNIRRSEVQRQLSAIEPEKDTRLKSIEADQADLTARFNSIERDAELPLDSRSFSKADRVVAAQQVKDQLEELPARRARLEEEFSQRASEMQDQLSAIEVEAAQKNSERNRLVRGLQENGTRAANRRNAHQRELERLRESLNTLIAEEKAAETSSEAERLATQKAREVEGHLAAISEDRDRLQQQLEEMEPVVDAHREATSGQGAEDLAKFYADSADGHRTAWRWSLVLLIVTIAVCGGAGVFIVDEVSPGKEPEPQEVFHAVAITILAIGLLLYLVRIASLQFRVHRHLEAVDCSKAAALRTYNRIVSGATSDVRGTLVATLADAVFRTSDSGFVDGSSDHVTLIERAVGTISQRATSSR